MTVSSQAIKYKFFDNFIEDDILKRPSAVVTRSVAILLRLTQKYSLVHNKNNYSPNSVGISLIIVITQNT